MDATKSLKIRLNVALRGFPANQEITFSRGGLKLDRYWMRLIKDSKFDNCLSIISEDLKNPEKEKKEANKLSQEKSVVTNPKSRKDNGDK